MKMTAGFSWMAIIGAILALFAMFNNFRNLDAAAEPVDPVDPVVEDPDYVTMEMYRDALQAADDAFLVVQAQIDVLKTRVVTLETQVATLEKTCEEPFQGDGDIGAVLERVIAVIARVKALEQVHGDADAIIARVEALERPHDWDVDSKVRCFRWLWTGVKWQPVEQAPSLAPDLPERIGPPPTIQKCSTGTCAKSGCSTCRR